MYLKLSLDIFKLLFLLSLSVRLCVNDSSVSEYSRVMRTINTRTSSFTSISPGPRLRPGLDGRLISVTLFSSPWSFVFTNKTVIVDRLVRVLTNCLNSLLFSVNINTNGNIPADSWPTNTRFHALKSQQCNGQYSSKIL